MKCETCNDPITLETQRMVESENGMVLIVCPKCSEMFEEEVE